MMGLYAMLLRIIVGLAKIYSRSRSPENARDHEKEQQNGFLSSHIKASRDTSGYSIHGLSACLTAASRSHSLGGHWGEP